MASMASTNTSLQATPNVPNERVPRPDVQTLNPDAHDLASVEQETPQSSLPPPSKTASRTCRICFETLSSASDPTSGEPSYVNSDSSNGRLLHPCKCSGSQRYVHESCLQSYRTHNLLQESYVKCSTCGYSYRLETSPLRGFITHSATQVLTTGTMVAFLIFTGGHPATPLLSITVRFRQTLEYGVVTIPWYTENRGRLDHFAQGAVLVGLTGIAIWLSDIIIMLWTRVWHPSVWFMVFLGLLSPQGDSHVFFWIQMVLEIFRVAYSTWCMIRTQYRRLAEGGGMVKVVEYRGNVDSTGGGG
jgi:hypothetical protein